MDSRKFLLAMNELDDRMILKAARYGTRRAAWVQFWDEAGPWAASFAALAAMVLLFIGLNSAGLLRDPAPLSDPAAENRVEETASDLPASSAANALADSSLPESTEALIFSSEPFQTNTADNFRPENGWSSELYAPYFASIFGCTDDLIWCGVNMTEVFGSKLSNPFGTVIFDQEQNVHRFMISASDPFYLHIELTPDALPPSCVPGDFVPNQLVFGTEVDARKYEYDDGTVRYEVRFIRDGGETGETIGVRGFFENKRGKPSEAEVEHYVNLFVRQALDPAQTLQLSQLSLNYPKDPPHASIEEDGTIIYDDIYTQQVYELYMHRYLLSMHQEETSESTAPLEPGQRVQIVVPDLCFATGCTMGGRARRYLFVLLKEEYRIYEQDGAWVVSLENAYCDLAGFRLDDAQAETALDGYHFWQPSDGSQYAPSLLEFCESITWAEGGQDAQTVADGAIEHLSARREALTETARQLLEDYLAQNGITDYSLLS